MANASQLPPTAVTWSLDDVPGAFVAPWTWKQTRGFEPYATVIMQPDDRFAKLANPCRLVISTPGRTLRASKEVVFEGLYLLEQGRTTRGLYMYTLADLRWALQAGGLTWAYNVRSFGNRYRPETLDGGGPVGVTGGAPWKVADAVKHALLRLADDVKAGLGRDVLRGNRVEVWTTDPRLIAGDLPDNLGNSAGAGWIGAKLSEFGPAMLRDAGDLVVTRDGRLRIVDRSAKAAEALEEYVLLDGLPTGKRIEWQKPKTLRVAVDQWYGGVFDVVAGDVQSQTADRANSHVTYPTPAAPGSLLVENVYPKLDPGAITQLPSAYDADDTADTAREDFVTLDQLNALPELNRFVVTELQIRRGIMRPNLVNRDELTAPQRALADVYEQTIRKHWRRTWRVRNDEVRRRYVNIELGKIQKDGTVKPATVLADYVRHFRWQRQQDGPLSSNVAYSASPFVARWLDPESLVFTLETVDLPRSVQAVYLGAFVKDVRFASLRDIVEDDDRTSVFEEAAEFSSSFRLRVYWRGLYAGYTPAAERAHTIDRELFSDGAAGRVTMRAYGISSVWSADAVEGPFVLLNDDELQPEADRLAQQVKASYTQERSGQAEFGGIEVLGNEAVEVYGEIYEIAVHVGGGSKAYETRTVVDYRPEVRPILPRAAATARPASPRTILAGGGGGLQGAI